MIDSKLSALDRAIDDDAMRERFAASLDSGRPPVTGVRHAVLKHTPGKRCVIEYWITAPGVADERLIGKVYRDQRGVRVFDTLRRLHAATRGNGHDGQTFHMAEPLAYYDDLGMVVQTAVPGVELGVLPASGDWAGAMRAVADNLAALHELPVAAEPRTLAELTHKLCRPRPGELVTARPELADAVKNIVQAVALADAGGPGMNLVHADFGLGQVLYADGRAAFVDLDGVCRSHAALDVANFLVSLRLKLGPLSPGPERIFRDRYLERRPQESLAMLSAFEALAYLRRGAAVFRKASDRDDVERAGRLLAIGNWIARAALDGRPGENGTR
ncbi:MAG TPA: phosphotransferase [Methylomirabilota bacterium]|jgi:Ser/Thr protein kinase RdoA (MazF antagonist)|nr:phosphotransferase [Methylomirabilota bacterium]